MVNRIIFIIIKIFEQLFYCTENFNPAQWQKHMKLI